MCMYVHVLLQAGPLEYKEGMQTFGEVETGKQDEAQYGVIGLLEIIASDFANVEAQHVGSDGN